MKLAAGVFDYEDAVRRVGGVELLKAHAWEFLELHQDHMTQMREALRQRDPAALAQAARTLHTALRGLSGARCRAQALAVERCARYEDFDEAASALGRLEAGLADLVVALDTVVSPKLMN